jgi:hypothetical protein
VSTPNETRDRILATLASLRTCFTRAPILIVACSDECRDNLLSH